MATFSSSGTYFASTPPHPSTRSLILASGLFLLTLVTSLLAGTHFAAAYAHNQAASLDAFFETFRLLYRNPAALLAGLPFAITLLGVLLVHELGHYFACRHHHIRSSYPFFIPAPTLIGTFGAFILIRSPIRSKTRFVRRRRFRSARWICRGAAGAGLRRASRQGHSHARQRWQRGFSFWRAADS